MNECHGGFPFSQAKLIFTFSACNPVSFYQLVEVARKKLWWSGTVSGSDSSLPFFPISYILARALQLKGPSAALIVPEGGTHEEQNERASLGMRDENMYYEV